MKPFLKKEHEDLPDFYGVKITYANGKDEDYEIVSHGYMQNITAFDQDGNPRERQHMGLLELATKNDGFIVLPLCNIFRIEFDKNFSKIVALKRKKDGLN